MDRETSSGHDESTLGPDTGYAGRGQVPSGRGDSTGTALWEMDSQLLDLLPVAVCFCDSDGLVVRWNRSARELWGREPLKGDRTMFCGSHRVYSAGGDLMDPAETPMALALQSGQSLRVPKVIFERPDGSRRPATATIHPIRDERGEVVGAVNVLQDLSNGAPDKSDFATVDGRFRRLLEKLPAAAYTCDPDGLITYYNERAVELWGRAPALHDPVDRFCGSFLLFQPGGPPIQHEECWMALALRERRDFLAHEIVVERPDGTRRTALAYATPFHDEDTGVLIGAANVLVDITERKDAQERINRLLVSERIQSEQLREADRRKNEFLAMLAHELRNPLAPLRSGLDLLAMDAPDEDVVAVMQEQVDHVVRLVDDLLDVSRIMRGRIELRCEPMRVATLVKRSIESVRGMLDDHGQRLEVHQPDEDIWTFVDPVRIVQVIGNLLNNASKYTDAGGRIRLSVARDREQVVITVDDSGVGIEPDLLPRVFDLFTQSSRSLDRSRGGLGIGLTLAHRLVEMHGGSISAHSDGPGRGSTFVVKLDAVDEPSSIVDPTCSNVNVARCRRILVVDDNRGAAWLLGRLLKKLDDHQIDTVYDGPTALARIREAHPEIVLLDIGLPGMDGFEVGQRIRRELGLDQILLVALTGYGQEEHRKRSKEAGFDEHLVKPPSLEQLRQLLHHPKLSEREP